MVGIHLVYITDQVYDESEVYNIYFKKKQNQVGRFEFDVHSTDYDADVFKERNYVIISVNGAQQFEGYISKVQNVQNRNVYHVEGKSLEGIFDTKVSGVPVRLMQDYTDDEQSFALAFLSYIMFSSAMFLTTDFKLQGAKGAQLFHYKIDGRAVIDHINTLSRISGCDWKCYLDV